MSGTSFHRARSVFAVAVALSFAAAVAHQVGPVSGAGSTTTRPAPCVSTKQKPATAGALCRADGTLDSNPNGTSVAKLPAGASSCQNVAGKEDGLSSSTCTSDKIAVDAGLVPTLSRAAGLDTCPSIDGKTSDPLAGCANVALVNGSIEPATFGLPSGPGCPEVVGKDASSTDVVCGSGPTDAMASESP